MVKQFGGARIDFGINSAGTVAYVHAKKSAQCIPLTTHTQELKMGHRPRCKTIKLTLETRHNLGLNKDFFKFYF